MRKSLLKFFLCLSVFLSAPAAMAAPADDAAAVLTKWEKNFNSGDVDATVGLYAPGATVFGTLSPALTSGTEGLKSYFAAGAKNKTQVKVVGSPTATKVSDSVVVLSGIYEFSGTRADGQSFTAPARYTFVIANVDGQWRIMHQHSSPQPRPPQ
ncbi:MAG: SgcJ/EcaC family oxidoreductase [Afipia sp.]|jgi:uncharacterized protein (TIGR02246 family)|nr:SgcJ/EcaC family oxidoreductase [Afipia sp.]